MIEWALRLFNHFLLGSQETWKGIYDKKYNFIQITKSKILKNSVTFSHMLQSPSCFQKFQPGKHIMISWHICLVKISKNGTEPNGIEKMSLVNSTNRCKFTNTHLYLPFYTCPCEDQISSSSSKFWPLPFSTPSKLKLRTCLKVVSGLNGGTIQNCGKSPKVYL